MVAFGLQQARAEPARPPYPSCWRITSSEYETLHAQTPRYGQDIGYITHDPEKPGVDYYWQCNGMEVERYITGQYSNFYGVNVGAGFSGVYAVNGLNEFDKTGPATTRMAPTNTSPAGTVSANLLFPLNIALPGGMLINIGGVYGSYTYMHQTTSTVFPDFVPGVTATNNIAGGILLGRMFPMTQSMVFTKFGFVTEHHDFFIQTPGLVTSEHANVSGLQTGGGAAWTTPWPGVSIVAEVDGNFFRQHTFDGGPA